MSSAFSDLRAICVLVMDPDRNTRNQAISQLCDVLMVPDVASAVRESKGLADYVLFPLITVLKT